MQANGKIGVLMPEIADPLDFELLRGIQTQAFRLGLDVIVLTGIFNAQTEMMHDDYINGLENIYTLICKASLDGILFPVDIFRSRPLIEQILHLLSQTDIPCLILGEECLPFQNIYPRQQESVRMLTKHLIEAHGCRKLICITGFPQHHSSSERAAGFRQAMYEAGLPVSESDIFYGHFWKEIPAQIGQQIVDGTLAKPDGIVCTSDPMAAALIGSLQANGIRVPEDIRVTGYDGSWDAWLCSPRITTVSGRDRQYGEDAVMQLYEMMTGMPAGFSEYPQTIRYGMSCGCSASENSADALLTEQYLRAQIQRSMERRQYLTANLIDRLRSAETLAEWAKEVDHVGYMLPAWQWLDVCLCADWCADADNPSQFRQHGFPDSMLLALSKRRGENQPSMLEYPTAEILPALCQPHEPKLVLLSSLHAHGQFFGFLATAYHEPEEIQADASYVYWCDAAANGLFALQKRINTVKMRAQIELLTVHDPETGLLNRRGLAERLPDMLHTAKKQHTTAQILLIACHETVQHSGYDTAQLLASALRHTTPETAVCARMQETLFAVMFLQSDTESEMLLMRAEQRFQKLLGQKSTAPKLISSVLDLQFPTLHETEQGISEAAAVLIQQAAVSDGMYDYKEVLARMRREIMSEPQKEWNIEQLAHSAGISRSHLQRLYKQFFNVSCMEDIIASRMNRAKQLLTYTDLRIQEIAMQCGYNNESHFRRQFKERIGMTAVQYRTKTTK